MFHPVWDEMSKITFLLPKFCAYGTCVNNPANPLILLIPVQTIMTTLSNHFCRAYAIRPNIRQRGILKKGRIKIRPDKILLEINIISLLLFYANHALKNVLSLTYTLRLEEVLEVRKRSRHYSL